TPHEIVGQHFLNFVHPDDRSALESGWQQTLSAKGSDSKVRFLTKKGSEIPVRISSNVHVAEGKVVSVTGILTERTEHRAAREGRGTGQRKEPAR
ncbi:MAG TPA: PAS domain-containing protein, partial [Bacteroidota bacterium]|nr:PAS domain-containing protein [Bacteroidota bacterium]